MTLCSKTFQSQIMSNLYQTRFNTIGMIGGFDQYFKNSACFPVRIPFQMYL